MSSPTDQPTPTPSQDPSQNPSRTPSKTPSLTPVNSPSQSPTFWHPCIAIIFTCGTPYDGRYALTDNWVNFHFSWSRDIDGALIYWHSSGVWAMGGISGVSDLLGPSEKRENPIAGETWTLDSDTFDSCDLICSNTELPSQAPTNP